MRTFTCRSTFLYEFSTHLCVETAEYYTDYTGIVVCLRINIYGDLCLCGQDEPGDIPGGECSGAGGAGPDAGGEPPGGRHTHARQPHLAAPLLQVRARGRVRSEL